MLLYGTGNTKIWQVDLQFIWTESYQLSAEQPKQKNPENVLLIQDLGVSKKCNAWQPLISLM